MALLHAQYGPDTEAFPASVALGALRRNAAGNGWEFVIPADLLLAAAAAIGVNGQRLANLGTATDPADAVPLAQAQAFGIYAKNVSAYILTDVAVPLGTTQPLSGIPDAAFNPPYTPNGSCAGSGTPGIICGVFASAAAETGTGAGQAGLGSAASATQPYNSTDFPGQHFKVKFLDNLGAPLTLGAMWPACPPAEVGQEAYGYLSYRSDLGLNLKGRIWFYYENTVTGWETPFTPTVNVTADAVYSPVVSVFATQPVEVGLGTVQAAGAITGLSPSPVGEITEIDDAVPVAGATGHYADGGHQHPHGSRGGGSLHALAIAGGAAGFLSGALAQVLANIPNLGVVVPQTTQVIAGAGMTGGGALSGNVTINVVANADGSIIVNADDIQVGIINATQHGAQTDATLHAVATQLLAGFMSATDKAKLDNLSGSSFNVAQQTVNATPLAVNVYTPNDGKAIQIQFSVEARKADGTAAAWYRIAAGFRRSGGTTTQVGSTRVVASDRDVGFTVSFDLTTSGTAIQAVLTGLATTIDWRVQGSVSEVP